MRNVIFVAVLTLLLAACGASTADGKPIYFQDDFSSSGSGWTEDTIEQGLVEYADGSYRILVTEEYYSIWSYMEHGDQTDVSVEVDATKIGGDDINEFGVMCRYGITETFYAGLVTSDGYYGIMSSTILGDLELLGTGEFQVSDVISTGAATNHIRLDCVGNQLSLYANGELLMQVTDDTHTTGYVGLYAGTYEVGGTDVLFDNFVVHAP